MIRRILAWTAAHGVTDAVLNLHHLPETLTAVVGDGRDLGVRVRYSWEQPRVLGSAGGPRLALPILGTETFFLINGDTLTDVDLTHAADTHRETGALVTMAVVPNREFLRYGGVRVDADGTIAGFTARGPAAEGTWHFIGVQVVAASVFASLTPGVAANTIGGIYEALIRTQPGSVRALRGEWAFFDVGTPADYLRTAVAFVKGDPGDAGRRTRIDPSAHIDQSVLWDDVEVGAGASLAHCIVTDGVRVPPGAIFKQSILMTGDDDQLAVTPIGD